MKKIYFILIFLFASCQQQNYKVSFVKNKKIPKGNSELLMQYEDSLQSVSNSNIENLQTESKMFSKIESIKPRQNIFARKNELPQDIVNDFHSGALLVKNNQNTNTDFLETENVNFIKDEIKNDIIQYKNNANLLTQAKTNTSSNRNKIVLINNFQNKQNAEKARIQLSKYTGLAFVIKEDNGNISIQSNANKPKAYKVANMALNLGYYNVQVVG